MRLLKIFKKIILLILAAAFITSAAFASVIFYRYSKVKNAIDYSSVRLGVNKSVIIAVAYTESKFNAAATSDKGAAGVMQIMPPTAKFIRSYFGYDADYNLYDADCNVFIGALYLKYLIEKYRDEAVVFACYNAGEGNVVKWFKNEPFSIEKIPYKETVNYVKKVIKLKNALNKLNVT